MNHKLQLPEIPYDMYESNQEILIILPLGWVKKESLNLKIEDYRLIIRGERITPPIKESLSPIKEECYRGDVSLTIDLPAQIYFNKIHSKLTPENILEIVIPKAEIPKQIEVEIQS